MKFNATVLLQTITAQNSGPALIFYLVAMVVNLVMMQTEDSLRVSLYNSTMTNVTVVRSLLASRSLAISIL